MSDQQPPKKKRSLGAFLTGTVEQEPQLPTATPPSSVSDAPLYPPARTRRPVTRVARPVTAAPPRHEAPPQQLTDQAGQPFVPMALPDHQAPPGAVLVAGFMM